MNYSNFKINLDAEKYVLINYAQLCKMKNNIQDQVIQ